MNQNKLSNSSFKIAACFVFDIAMIIAFFNTFSLFSLLAPIKSILMLLVLLTGLLVINAVIIFSKIIVERFGFVYTKAIIFISILYALIANSFSVLFIIGSTTAYLIWELLILAVFIGLTSLVTAFANGAVRDNESIQVEQSMKSKINIQLLNIESILFEKASHNEDISKITASFKRLKERINASTPFGRIRNNYAVTEMENKILSNLSLIEVNLSKPITGENKNSIENLIDETYRFVINREKLNIY